MKNTRSVSISIYSFQIKSADALLYAGKFTVGKYLYNPAKNPAFNKNPHLFPNRKKFYAGLGAALNFLFLIAALVPLIYFLISVKLRVL